MQKVFVVVMGSGFPKDRPVNEAGWEILDVWGAKRLEAGIRRVRWLGDGATLCLTGNLRNEVTGQTVADVSYELAMRELDEGYLHMILHRIFDYECSTRGDIQQAMTGALFTKENIHFEFVSEKPHFRRITRIFLEEKRRHPQGALFLDYAFIPSGAPAPWWYYAKETMMEFVIGRWGENSRAFKICWRVWDWCKTILLNMPRKPHLYNKR